MRLARKWMAVLLSLFLLVSLGITALAEEAEAPEPLTETVAELPAEEPAEELVAEPSEEPAEVSSEDTKAAAVSYYKNYVAIGDSCGSGVGLPQYLQLAAETGQMWIACEKIEGSYPTLLAEALGVETYSQYHFPGARTADIRYLLDPTFRADWVLLGQAMYLSNGVVSKENLDAYRDEVIEAVRNADLISVDVGINDCWMPVVAALYDIAGEGRSNGRLLTVPELVARFGSVGALMDNILSYVRAWVANPLRWGAYVSKLTSAMFKWVVDYQVNTAAIMDRIYQLNPNATLIVCGMYNPVEGWGLVGVDNTIELLMQPYYSMLNLRKKLEVQLYRGKAIYVEMNGVELVSDHFTIPLFEFATDGIFGYNPHPTLNGAKTQLNHILKALHIPTR